MANQHSINLQLDPPEIAESLGRYLRELQDRSDGESQDSQDWRSISETIERVAEVLQAVAHHAKCGPQMRARHLVLQLIELMDQIGPWLTAHGVIFTAVSVKAGDLVSIGSLTYDSSHHAAYCEVRSFLITLVRKLRPKYSMEEAFGSVIVKDWDRARDAILDMLPQSWQEEFKPVRVRIRRERADLERAESQSAWQTVPPSLHEAANQSRASKAPAKGHTNPYDVVGRSSSGNSLKKIKPTPETLVKIRMLERGRSYGAIIEALPKEKVTVENLRKINSRRKNGEYEL